VPRAGFANHFADCLGDAAKDPELKAVFADVHAREADPRQKDAVVPPNPRHLLDHLSQLDRADRVVGVVQSAMQPYELKSTVSQYLRRQGIPGAVGYIDDNPLNPLRALGENRYLPAGADDKPCRPGVDGTADWRYGPAVWVHDDVHRVNPHRERPVKRAGVRDIDRYTLAPNPHRQCIKFQQLGRVADSDTLKSLAV
jgi:hypothetical protein